MEHLARSGDAEAKFKTAHSYMTKEVVERDVDRAVYWHQRAVEAGYRDSAFALSRLYLLGDQVPRDLVQALYFAMASFALTEDFEGPDLVRAESESLDLIESIVLRATPAQQKEADALFREWLANR